MSKINMHEEMDQILQDCFKRIEQEGATIEACLTLHPQHQEELSELLVLSTSIKNLNRIQPSKEFVSNSPSQLMAKLPDQQFTFGDKIRKVYQAGFQIPPHRMAWARAFIILALVIILGTSVVYAADSAGPGDLLYQLDRSIEQIRLRITSDPQEIAKIRLAHAAERLEEAAKSIERSEFENSTFAFKAYQSEIEQLPPLMEQSNNQNQIAIEAMINEGLTIHEETLRRLMNSAPEDALDSIQNAINASRKGLIGAETPTEPPQSEEAPQGPPEDAPQGPNEHTPQTPKENPPQGPKEETTQPPATDVTPSPNVDQPQGTPQNPTETTPQGNSDDKPQGNSDETPQGPNEDSPQGPNEDIPQDPSEKTPQGYNNENHAKP